MGRLESKNSRKIMENIASPDIRSLYQRQGAHWGKIILFIGLWIGAGAVAWNVENIWAKVLCYLFMGYMQMAMATFFHECTHNVMFAEEWKNWVFGIVGFIALVAPYTSYRDDHLLHHRYNRTKKDTAAFTMGKRGWLDFAVFYTYVTAGIVLLLINFNFVHPFLFLKGKKFWLHWFEVALHVVVYVGVGMWAAHYGVLNKLLEVTLWPLLVFSYLNSFRFLAEHYGTPWERGQLAGSRTIISNPVHSWFWNNINYHIGHHVYPAVPWYNLKKLHYLMLPQIEKEGGIVEKSLIAAVVRIILSGPETPEMANGTPPASVPSGLVPQKA